MSEPDIFFSYAREDQARVTPVVAALEAGGWSVFWDRRIPAGQTWRGHIGTALEQARCVVVAWSEHSINSEWVIEEADDGRERGLLVPVFLDPVRPPRGFRGIQAADLSGWSPERPSPAFDSFLADLGAVLGAAQPRPSPRSPAAEVSPAKQGLGDGDKPARRRRATAVDPAGGGRPAGPLPGDRMDTAHASETPVSSVGQPTAAEERPRGMVRTAPASFLATPPPSGPSHPIEATHPGSFVASGDEPAEWALGAAQPRPSPRSPAAEVSPAKQGLGEQDEPATLRQGAAVDLAGGHAAAGPLAGAVVGTSHAMGRPRDVAGGLLVAAIGAGFFLFGRELELGTSFRMGPGYFPTVLSLLMIGLGAAMTVLAWRAPRREGAFGHVPWRGVLLVVGATIFFGFALRGLGLAPVLVLVVLATAWASRYASWRNSVPLALGLAAFCVLLFVRGLGLPLPLLGPWVDPQRWAAEPAPPPPAPAGQ